MFVNNLQKGEVKVVIEPRTFRAKDGRKVVLRSVKWDDLDDLMDLINSLVEGFC